MRLEGIIEGMDVERAAKLMAKLSSNAVVVHRRKRFVPRADVTKELSRWHAAQPLLKRRRFQLGAKTLQRDWQRTERGLHSVTVSAIELVKGCPGGRLWSRCTRAQVAVAAPLGRP